MKLLDLNEYILREIFVYLDHHEVYYTLRNVCQYLQMCAENYIQLGGVFMLTSVPGMPCKIFHIFKQNSKVISIYSSLGPSLPRPSTVGSISTGSISTAVFYNNSTEYTPSNLTFDIGVFGSTLQGKIVVGMYYTEEHKKVPKRSKVRPHLYKERFCYLNEYDPWNNKWIPIPSKDRSYQYLNGTSSGVNCVMSWCPLGGSMIVMEEDAFQPFNHIRRINLNIDKHQKHPEIKNSRMLRMFQRNKKSKHPCSANSVIIPLPIELQNVIECTLVQTEYDKLMLVGGIYEDYRPNTMLWQGSIANNINNKIATTKSDLCWHPMNVELTKARLMPICFKLKSNLYIAGGNSLYALHNPSGGRFETNGRPLLCCDRFDLNEKKYYSHVYSLPYPICDLDKVVTDSMETFAIILNSKTGSFLIFTEKDGFAEFPDFTIFGKMSVAKPFFFNCRATSFLRIE